MAAGRQITTNLVSFDQSRPNFHPLTAPYWSGHIQQPEHPPKAAREIAQRFIFLGHQQKTSEATNAGEEQSQVNLRQHPSAQLPYSSTTRSLPRGHQHTPLFRMPEPSLA
jgi:hypothetical protein